MMCTVLPLYIVEIARSANRFTSRSAFLLASALSASRRNERRVSSRFCRASSAKTQNFDSRRPAVTKSFAKRFRYRSLALTSSKRPAVSSAKTRTGSSQAAASFVSSAASPKRARISGGADARSVADSPDAPASAARCVRNARSSSRSSNTRARNSRSVKARPNEDEDESFVSASVFVETNPFVSFSTFVSARASPASSTTKPRTSQSISIGASIVSTPIVSSTSTSTTSPTSQSISTAAGVPVDSAATPTSQSMPPAGGSTCASTTLTSQSMPSAGGSTRAPSAFVATSKSVATSTSVVDANAASLSSFSAAFRLFSKSRPINSASAEVAIARRRARCGVRDSTVTRPSSDSPVSCDTNPARILSPCAQSVHRA
mmetsp:Transcript_3970/g.16856  ORF Transcript_3970/g.16856 Transcript_3970/m.16856 type:complete len:375 (-) Transcript_3970:922-2046(-)